MKWIVCSIYDEKAKAFMQPYTVMNVPMAVRQFGNSVNGNTGRGADAITLNPEDFTLFQVAVFDDQNGEFELTRTMIGNGVQYRKGGSSNEVA